MTFVLKVSLKPDHVLLVFRICLCKLLQYLNLFQSRFLPAIKSVSGLHLEHMILHCLVTSDEFDSNQLVIRLVHCSHYAGEHSFA